MKQYEHDIDYLTKFYEQETKTMMEQNFNKRMVAMFYRETLKYNSMKEEPRDLGELERLLCHYLTTDDNKDGYGFNIK